MEDSTKRLKTFAGGVRPEKEMKDREPNEPHHGWHSGFHESQHPSQRRSGVATFVTVRAGMSPIPKWSDGFRDRVKRIDSQLFRVCCCAASVCRCPSAVSVLVAVLSTSLAITEQHAAWWGCSAGEVVPWRVLSPRFVAKAGPGCPPTSW